VQQQAITRQEAVVPCAPAVVGTTGPSLTGPMPPLRQLLEALPAVQQQAITREEAVVPCAPAAVGTTGPSLTGPMPPLHQLLEAPPTAALQSHQGAVRASPPLFRRSHLKRPLAEAGPSQAVASEAAAAGSPETWPQEQPQIHQAAEQAVSLGGQAATRQVRPAVTAEHACTAGPSPPPLRPHSSHHPAPLERSETRRSVARQQRCISVEELFGMPPRGEGRQGSASAQPAFEQASACRALEQPAAGQMEPAFTSVEASVAATTYAGGAAAIQHGAGGGSDSEHQGTHGSSPGRATATRSDSSISGSAASQHGAGGGGLPPLWPPTPRVAAGTATSGGGPPAGVYSSIVRRCQAAAAAGWQASRATATMPDRSISGAAACQHGAGGGGGMRAGGGEHQGALPYGPDAAATPAAAGPTNGAAASQHGAGGGGGLRVGDNACQVAHGSLPGGAAASQHGARGGVGLCVDGGEHQGTFHYKPSAAAAQTTAGLVGGAAPHSSPSVMPAAAAASVDVERLPKMQLVLTHHKTATTAKTISCTLPPELTHSILEYIRYVWRGRTMMNEGACTLLTNEDGAMYTAHTFQDDWVSLQERHNAPWAAFQPSEARHIHVEHTLNWDDLARSADTQHLRGDAIVMGNSLRTWQASYAGLDCKSLLAGRAIARLQRWRVQRAAELGLQLPRV
jgi:hypothetical protein